MIAIVVVTVAILLVFGFGALLLFRGFENSARRALERKYRDLVIHPVPQYGDVLLEFHTYHGLIAWFTQTGHRVYLSPDDARKLLGRLLRFNLTWGLVTPGSLFIPPLAIMIIGHNADPLRRRKSQAGIVATPPLLVWQPALRSFRPQTQ